MPNPQILPGTTGFFGINGLDANGTTPRTLGGGTVTIDNYSVAYVAVFHPDANAQYYVNVVPKAGGVPEGGTTTVNVTVNAKSANGTALPPVIVSFDVQGPPPPPQAASAQIVAESVRTQFNSSTTDPGSATATLS